MCHKDSQVTLLDRGGQKQGIYSPEPWQYKFISIYDAFAFGTPDPHHIPLSLIYLIEDAALDEVSTLFKFNHWFFIREQDDSRLLHCLLLQCSFLVRPLPPFPSSFPNKSCEIDVATSLNNAQSNKSSGLNRMRVETARRILRRYP